MWPRSASLTGPSDRTPGFGYRSGSGPDLCLGQPDGVGSVAAMSSRPTRPARWASLGGLLFLALMAAGLFAMHGLQPSASPMDMPGVPLVASADMHAADTGHAGGHSSQHHSPGHEHPGGQMCLGLLVIAALFLLSAVLIRRAAWRSGLRRPAGPAHEHRGRPPRPPPSIYRLSVLRL
jgi:hypothetical protein